MIPWQFIILIDLLSPKMVEALVCAQSWFRSTPLPEDMEIQNVADEIEEGNTLILIDLFCFMI